MGWSAGAPRTFSSHYGSSHVNRNRLLITVAMVLTLIVLLAWQLKRNAQVAECHDKGGVWTGALCRPAPGRVRIQGDLRRS